MDLKKYYLKILTMYMRRRFQLMVVAVFMFIFLGTTNAKGGVGGRPVNPLDLDHKNWFIYHLQPGEQYADEVEILNTTDDDWEVEIYPADAIEQSDGFALKQKVESMEKMGKWIQIPQSSFLLKAGERKTISFTIAIPYGVNPEVAGGVMIEKKEAGKIDKKLNSSGIRLSTRSGVRVYNTLKQDFDEKTSIKDEIAMVPQLLAQTEGNRAQPSVNLAQSLKADLLSSRKESKENTSITKKEKEGVVTETKKVSPISMKADLLSQKSRAEVPNNEPVEKQEQKALVEKIENDGIAFLEYLEEEKARRVTEGDSQKMENETRTVTWEELANRQSQKEQKEAVFVNSLKADLLTKKKIEQPKKEDRFKIPAWAQAEQELIGEYRTYVTEGGQTEFDYWVDHIRQTLEVETDTFLGKVFSPWGKRFLYNVFH